MNIQNLSYETYCKGKMQYTYGNIAICCDFRPSKSLFVVIEGLNGWRRFYAYGVSMCCAHFYV